LYPLDLEIERPQCQIVAPRPDVSDATRKFFAAKTEGQPSGTIAPPPGQRETERRG
jgi:hypothetical protein